MPEAEPSLDIASQRRRASVASWLGVLFLLVLVLIAVGGFVRLTGAGQSLPGWPLVNGQLLPPLSDADVHVMHQSYRDGMATLSSQRSAGMVGLRAQGALPDTSSDYQRLALITWSHRFLAALVAIISLGCLTVILRDRSLRRVAGPAIGFVVGLIVVQSILGGVLVLTNASTKFLALHLGMGALVLAAILWMLLGLLQINREPLDADVIEKRRPALRWVKVALVVVFIQFLLGAFSAGSRHIGFSQTWPLMHGELVPTLWFDYMSASANLLDNPALHQWLHRWFAAVSVIVLGAFAWRSRQSAIGLRGRLAVSFSMSLLGAQMVLGIMNVFTGASMPIALAHLVVGMLLFSGLVLAWYDIKHEPVMVEEPAVAPVHSAPAPVGGRV